MISEWWLLVCSALLGVVSLLTTCVFCFWFVYLFTLTRSKLKFYRNELTSLKQENNDFQQQIIVYNAKTQLVMNVFMFFINLVEWLAFIFGRVAFIIYFIRQYQHDASEKIQSQNTTQLQLSVLLLLNKNKNRFLLPLPYNLLFLASNFLVLGLVLVGCLCMYLAARYAMKSWIRSASIPYLICFFLLCVVVNQVSVLFCLTSIIANWSSIVVLTVALVFALKQYRKLSMVISWTIVDLKISQNTPLLMKQIKMKRVFIRVFRGIWIGTFLLLFSEYLGVILHTSLIVLHNIHSSSFQLSLCETSHLSLNIIHEFCFALFFSQFILGVLGAAFIFIPYLGYGFSTMLISLWRQCYGKSTYKTHYHDPLNSPLI